MDNNNISHVWVATSLLHDWQSRGLIYEMHNQNLTCEVIRTQGRRKQIAVCAQALNWMISDAEYQADPLMEAEAGYVRTLRKFIADAQQNDAQ